MTDTTPTTAVELVDEGKPKPLPVVIREAIERQSESLGQVLPGGIDPDRFARLVLTAVKSTPQLAECFATKQGQTSVLMAAMSAASVGLEPNTELQHAWILPRKVKGTMEAELQIGYRGLIDLARRSGDIKDIYAAVVREGDEFRVTMGLHRDLHHVPGAERGDITHAYAVAHFMTGGLAFEVLDRRELDRRRSKSSNKTEYGPWATSEEAMSKKSAIRALAPYLPLTAEAHRVMAPAELLDDDDREIVVPPPPVTAAELTAGAEVEA